VLVAVTVATRQHEEAEREVFLLRGRASVAPGTLPFRRRLHLLVALIIFHFYQLPARHRRVENGIHHGHASDLYLWKVWVLF
jgi:hypothetical protein